MKFTATLFLGGKTATGIRVPADVIDALGAGKRVPVVVTLNGGHSYRSTVAPYSGDFMLPVAAEHREAAGLKAGDEVEVTLEVDTAPRTVDVPADLADALAAQPAARQVWEKLPYSHQKAHVLAIEDAKTAETRARRIEKAVEKLLSTP